MNLKLNNLKGPFSLLYRAPKKNFFPGFRDCSLDVGQI